MMLHNTHYIILSRYRFFVLVYIQHCHVMARFCHVVATQQFIYKVYMGVCVMKYSHTVYVDIDMCVLKYICVY